jgi:hypothetical protein
MTAFLFDAVVVLAALGLLGALSGGLLARSRAGLRWRQARNRRRIEEERAHHCPRHGDHAARELVRLPSGETLCPQCYEEIYHADLQ